MKVLKYILLFLLVGIITIQFFPPAKNQSGSGVSVTDITVLYHVQGNVRTILQNACYDCHSNNTRYPWYVNIQPLGWFMAKHIKEGKAELNFNNFGAYSSKRQRNKLKRMKEQVEEGEMPLASYTLMHADARLSAEQKTILVNWIGQAIVDK
ncbi:heme-binding domain-containing protein [Chitinophaga sp. YIM B06452]|uniref:heme-binding domain-containing protein n=1 Tax=Chitinophaga sp. YIM B06452 TaxID=3082158 RepID=UPI0031FE88A9